MKMNNIRLYLFCNFPNFKKSRNIFCCIDGPRKIFHFNQMDALIKILLII